MSTAKVGGYHRIQRTVFDRIAELCGIQEQQLWYTVTPTFLKQHKLHQIVQQYDNCIHTTFRTIYPEYEWKPWLFRNVRTCWSSNNTISNSRQYVDWIVDQLGFQKQSELYKLSKDIIVEHGGSSLLNKYGGSVYNMIKNIYKEYDWYPWLFSSSPRNLWTEHKKEYFDWLANELGITQQMDWYSISADSIHRNAFGDNKSLFEVLKQVYPQFHWNEYLFDAPQQSIRAFFDEKALSLSICTSNDWYNVHKDEVEGTVLSLFGNSLFTALKNVYPEYEWQPWLLKEELHNFWTLHDNQRAFCDWFASENGIDEQQLWYQVKPSQLKAYGASQLLLYHKNSMHSLLSSVYGQYSWSKELFFQRYWSNTNNQRNYFNWVAKRLGICAHDDWYTIKRSQLNGLGNQIVSKFYNNSVVSALQSIYPEHNWNSWQFTKLPKHFWKSDFEKRNYLNHLLEVHDVETYEQLLHSPFTTLIKSIKQQRRILGKFGTWKNSLQHIYPEFEWYNGARDMMVSAGHSHVLQLLQRLLKNEIVLVNYKTSLLAEHRDIELDIYIPSLNLAFEYQGAQHYSDIRHYTFGSLAAQQSRDSEKRTKCRELGIKLVEIPHWMSLMHTQSSLSSIIHMCASK